MKKILFTLTCVIAMLANCLTVSAANRSLVNTYTKDYEKKHSGINVITNCIDSDDAKIQLNSDPQFDTPAEDLFSVCNDYDYMLTYDFKTNDESTLYPDIKKLQVRIITPQVSGGRGSTLGRNFRLYYIGMETKPEKIDFETIPGGISFTTGKLGRYALYFDEAVYDVVFYADEEGGELYTILKDLKEEETVTFPKIPQKDGYVFTGWKARSGSRLSFVSPQPQTALNPAVYYASWCEEKDYSPLEIQLESDNIIKGKEDGQTITVKLSDGFFDESHEDLLNMENWKLTGTEDVTIEKIELIDSKTMKLTLSGNSKELYTDSKIGVEFYHKLITFEITDENGQPIKTEDRKIQLDADGVEAAWYKSTNTINFNKQSKTENDGGRVVSTFTVKFDTNGGNNIASKTVKRNKKIEAIEEPVKAGFKFDGWYTDEALTEKFDPDAKIISSMTLYAKWSESLIDDSENEIVLTIGEKDALIFGETRINDVAPVIRNERTMLPSRFIAESLGASVEWNEEKQLVTIKGKNEKDEDIIILITIGSECSSVNGESIKLDSPAFIENDRTYTPIRFISEQLGASVDWNESEQKITITRKTVNNK